MPDPSARDPLIVRTLEFLGGMESPDGWRPESTLPEIAVAGRSNVGKSSLLNKLVRRKAVARVSRTPGRTRAINFFKVNEDFVLADLPGYGYAKVSKEQRASWKPLMEGYLRGGPQLRGLVLLLDIRRDVGEDDLTMLEYLSELQIPVLAILTKVDKLGTRERQERLTRLTKALAMPADQVIPFSAVTGEGRDELAEAVVGLAASPRESE